MQHILPKGSFCRKSAIVYRGHIVQVGIPESHLVILPFLSFFFFIVFNKIATKKSGGAGACAAACGQQPDPHQRHQVRGAMVALGTGRPYDCHDTRFHSVW